MTAQKMDLEHRQCFSEFGIGGNEQKSLTDQEQAICVVEGCIEAGHQVMVVLRGVPGSGKSTLARRLKNSGRVYTTDDFFCDRQGQYSFEPTKVGEAHVWNQKRVDVALDKKITPILIDNTNILAEHVRIYVRMAALNGYEVYFLEPVTEWRYNAFECQRKNSHGVNEEKIRKYLEQFQRRFTLQSLLPNYQVLFLDKLPLTQLQETANSLHKQASDSALLKRTVKPKARGGKAANKQSSSQSKRKGQGELANSFQSLNMDSWKLAPDSPINGFRPSALSPIKSPASQSIFSLLPSRPQFTVQSTPCQVDPLDITLALIDILFDNGVDQPNRISAASSIRSMPKRSPSSKGLMKDRGTVTDEETAEAEMTGCAFGQLQQLFSMSDPHLLLHILQQCADDLATTAFVLLDAGFQLEPDRKLEPLPVECLTSDEGEQEERDVPFVYEMTRDQCAADEFAKALQKQINQMERDRVVADELQTKYDEEYARKLQLDLQNPEGVVPVETMASKLSLQKLIEQFGTNVDPAMIKELFIGNKYFSICF